jgi:hypothetical protein
MASNINDTFPPGWVTGHVYTAPVRGTYPLAGTATTTIPPGTWMIAPGQPLVGTGSEGMILVDADEYVKLKNELADAKASIERLVESLTLLSRGEPCAL